MTACPHQLPLLSALIDNELDAANAAAIEAHAASCDGCGRTLAEWRGVRVAITGAPGMRDVAPAALRARIDALVPEKTFRVSRWRWAGGGAVIAIAASLALVLAVPPGANAELEDEVIASHVRSLQPGHLIDIATSDRHVVKPWFNGRIDFAPPVVDLKDRGFALVGGRLDYLRDGNVAALVYRHDRHVINLLIRPAPRGWMASAAVEHQRDGYGILRWRRGDLEFWAISDVDPASLHAFRTAVEQATR